MRAVSVEDLKPGMTLARTIINDDMIVVLSENTLLTKAHITRLEFLNIPVVYVKDEYELSQNYLVATSIFNQSNAFLQEYEGVVSSAKRIFEDTNKTGEVPVEETHAIIENDVAPLAKNSGAIDYLYELNHLASDIYNHSLRVSIMAGVIAKWMRLGRAKTQDVILAGFLHDIGKTNFSQKLLDKHVSKLTAEEYEEYIRHTVDGQQVVNTIPGLSDGVKLAVLQHHERMDGSGFPFGSTGADIHEYARIIAVADIYDNITTEREGFVKETPFTAIAYLTEHMFTTLDPGVCMPVLTHITDAFLGSKVVLNDGTKGVIAAYPKDYAGQPIISNEDEQLINLNDHPELKIIEYNPK